MTKKTQKLRKVLTLAACAVLLVSVTIVGTVAYLTSTTNVVKNTFAVGDVEITLDEGKVVAFDATNPAADHGQHTDEGVTRVTENAYKLFPGHEYDKDPQVTVKANSEKCYVRAFVTIKYNDAADEIVNMSWIEDLDQTNWIWSDPETTTENGVTTRVYEVRYNDVVATSTTDTKLPKLFTGINIPESITNDQLETLADFEINVVANAIQADGFADADAAWEAWN